MCRYNGWQARIHYYHWKKQSALGGACSEMTGYTRLCASEGGKPDGLEGFIPSVFVKALTTDVLKNYGHFGVLNRPHSVVEFFKSPELLSRVVEEYVLVAGKTRARLTRKSRASLARKSHAQVSRASLAQVSCASLMRKSHAQVSRASLTRKSHAQVSRASLAQVSHPVDPTHVPLPCSHIYNHPHIC